MVLFQLGMLTLEISLPSHDDPTPELITQSVNSQWPSQWEPSIFDSSQNRRPLTDAKKVVTFDCAHDFYSSAKFGGNLSMGPGGFWTNRNITQNFYLYHFKQLTYRSDSSPDFF